MKVFLNEYIDRAGMDLLKARAEVISDEARISEADAIISRGFPVPRELMERCQNLKVIGKHGVGYNQIDIAAAREKGIRVIYTPGQNTQSVAELAVGLMLAAARKLGGAYREILENRCSRVASMAFCGMELTGKTVGLIGIGSVGRHVAKMTGCGFNAKVIGYDAYAPESLFQEAGITRMKCLKDLLRNSDFISISVPLTDETRGMIGEEELLWCKSNAVLVNTSRGGIVDENSLYHALKAGTIRGAGFDVFADEPPAASCIRLFELPNFIGSSHIGGTTDEALRRCAITVVEEIFRVLDGKDPLYPVV